MLLIGPFVWGCRMKPTVHAMLPPFTGHTAQGLSFTNASAACQLLSMGPACISQLWLTCENVSVHTALLCAGGVGAAAGALQGEPAAQKA